MMNLLSSVITTSSSVKIKERSGKQSMMIPTTNPVERIKSKDSRIRKNWKTKSRILKKLKMRIHKDRF